MGRDVQRHSIPRDILGLLLLSGEWNEGVAPRRGVLKRAYPLGPGSSLSLYSGSILTSSVTLHMLLSLSEPQVSFFKMAIIPHHRIVLGAKDDYLKNTVFDI